MEPITVLGESLAGGRRLRYARHCRIEQWHRGASPAHSPMAHVAGRSTGRTRPPSVRAIDLSSPCTRLTTSMVRRTVPGVMSSPQSGRCQSRVKHSSEHGGITVLGHPLGGRANEVQSAPVRHQYDKRPEQIGAIPEQPGGRSRGHHPERYPLSCHLCELCAYRGESRLSLTGGASPRHPAQTPPL